MKRPIIGVTMDSGDKANSYSLNSDYPTSIEKAGGIPLLLGALAEQRFSEARARGFGDEDMAALVKLWEEPAGVKVSQKS